MHPILFYVGSNPIHTYGVLGAVGFLVVVFIVLRRSRALMINRDHVIDIIFWGAITGIVGSRAVFVYQSWDQMNGFWDWVNFRQGGLVFYGALIPGLPVVALLMRKYKIPFFPFMDIIATALPLGHAVSRLGCFFAGCCYGTPTDLPWGVTYTDSLTDAPHGVPLHPTQLYAVAYLVAIGALCNYFYSRKQFHGQVMLLYLLCYAVMRSLNEILRGDAARGYFLEQVLGQTLSTSQGLSLIVAATALGVFLWGARRARRANRSG